ncbi:MAG: carboxypeptidase M32 [Chloroflexota bacterium]
MVKMGQHLEQLKERLADAHNLARAAAVLGWDQQTYMPPGGDTARAAQLATISRLAHSIFTADETGALLQQSSDEVANLAPDNDDAALVRVALRDYEQDRKIPGELVVEMRRHGALSHAVWVQAREEDNFERFAPCLEKTVELSRQWANHLGYQDRMYDALLDQYEPGMKTAQVEEIFNNLKSEIMPLLRAINERVGQVDDSVLHQPFDEARQETFGKMVAERFGYDFTRGRQDRTVHPFETTFSRDDVRITTRFDPNFLNPALFGTMHETGHALYEQGVGESLEGTLLARGTSLGVHESQSRMWENVVGRSRGFWKHFYPQLQDMFPQQLGSTDVDAFYRAINRVEPSFIRVEADEVTYNMHIMVRFEMELGLLEDRFSVAEAPGVWNDKMQDYLGVRPPNNTVGILQDIHWSGGMMGYFPTYSIGNILSIQFYDAAVRDRPDIAEDITRGQFDTLRDWLTDRVYRHGRKYQPNELVERATGEPIQARAYVAYLRKKYGEIYGV